MLWEEELFGKVMYLWGELVLSDEFIHIENSFLNLQYPKSFIHYAKSKALKIHNKNQSQNNIYSISDKTSFCLLMYVCTV